MKTAVMTDTNSGITKDIAKELGIYVIPMPVIIGEETYYENDTITEEEFFCALSGDKHITTSQPSPGDVMNLWDQILNEGYDELVYVPMSSGLSNSCAAALGYSQEYEGKVEVIDNHRISVTMYESVLYARDLALQGASAKEIKTALETDAYNSSIYLTVNTLEYLKKGGRITPAAAAIGTMLRLKPVLTIQGEKLDAFAKARTTSQGKTMMINAIKKDINERFGGMTEDKHIWIQIAYTYDRAAAEQFRTEVEAEFPGYDIHLDPLSLSVACHIGPGSLALACCKKITV